MKDREIADNVFYVGADDKDIKLFEGQYHVPNGMSYNSYIIKDEKNVILDTIDQRATGEWLKNVEDVLGNEEADYLVISHMEPDHAYNIDTLIKKYPNMKLIGNSITFNILSNFFEVDIADKKIIVKEGDTINLGKHTLQFFMAPMVHWPEVMVTFEQSEKILFSADGFGKFGTLDADEDWTCEARRYYFGIVGKYGKQVQDLLKKANTLDIKMICPLHGPILKENLEYYIGKYDTWSSYKPEDKGTLVAYSSIYGNTAKVAEIIADILKENGEKVVLTDLVRDDMAEAVEDAFRYDKMILASSSYNAGIFPPMEEFLNHLKGRNYQNRKIGIIENGSWAPSAGKGMKSILESMKDIRIVEPMITIKSTMKQGDVDKLEQLAKEIIE